MKKNVNKLIATSIATFILILSLGVSIFAIDDEYINQDTVVPSSSSVPSSSDINNDIDNDLDDSIDDVNNEENNNIVIDEDDTPDYIYYNNVEDEYVPQKPVVSSQYVYDVPSSTSSAVSQPYSSASLIADLGNVDDPELSAEDWNISLDNTDGTGSFDFIKNSDQSTSGNAKWMLYTGIGLIAAGALGILFVVVDCLRNKQKKAKSNKYTSKRVAKSRNLKRTGIRNNNDYEDIMSSTQEIPRRKNDPQWDNFFKD